MKLLRYRRPSLRNLSGYTQVKRQAKRQLGISQVETESSEAARQTTRRLLLPHDARGSQHRERPVPVVPRAVQEEVAESAHPPHVLAPFRRRTTSRTLDPSVYGHR